MHKRKSNLTIYILGSIIIAIAFALIFPHAAMSFEIGGEVFLNTLKMLVVPLVISSVMSGVIKMGDIRKLGKPGFTAIGYYLTTTVIAVVIGIVAVNFIQPGSGTVNEEMLNETASQTENVKQKDANIGTILNNLVKMLFTDNLFSSAANTDLLPLIVFSIIFAGVLTTMSKRVEAITNIVIEINDALMALILLIMKIAPIGIFCLVASRFGEAQAEGQFLEVLNQVGLYVTTVLLALGFHAFVILPAIMWFVTKRNPYLFMYQMSQALLTAFSTASSSATLPVTMKSAVEKAKVSKKSVDFVLPIGATINMDGTALYEAVAAIFIAQAIGFELSLTAQMTVAITATLAAIGAAGIPEAGLVTMIIVLNAVGLPTEYVSLILSVDWFLDRFRTAINVFGDSVGATVVEKSF